VLVPLKCLVFSTRLNDGPEQPAGEIYGNVSKETAYKEVGGTHGTLPYDDLSVHDIHLIEDADPQVFTTPHPTTQCATIPIT
jgi:hypothetical protein